MFTKSLRGLFTFFGLLTDEAEPRERSGIYLKNTMGEECLSSFIPSIIVSTLLLV